MVEIADKAIPPVCKILDYNKFKYEEAKKEKDIARKNREETVETKEIALAGGVSANTGLRKALELTAVKEDWKTYVPAFQYCTDNAAMIAITGYYKLIRGEFADQELVPQARMDF